MKRLFNFRIIAAVSVSIICGAVAFYNSPKYGNYSLLILFGIIALIFILSDFIFGKYPLSKRIVAALICVFFACIGYGRLYMRVLETENGRVNAGVYTVSGMVNSISVREDGKYLELANCEYDGKKGGGLAVYSFDGDVDLYDEITLSCNVYPSRSVNDGEYTYAAINRISMNADKATLVENRGESRGIFYFVKNRITDKVYSDTDKDSAVALALLVGDTSKLTYDSFSDFRFSGIAHIFAVSGMHIGLLFVAVRFLLTKLGVGRWTKTVIVSLSVLFYAGVCGFSASAVRAAIMCVVFIVVKTMGEKNDRINSLAIAAIIISLVNVGDALGAGFVLSFTVCLSLIIVAPPIKYKLEFLGEKVSSALAAVISAQLASLPLCITYFAYFPALATFTNILLLPAVTLIYYAVWIGLLLNILLPFQSFGLFIPYIFIRGITFAANAVQASGLFITYFPKTYTAVYYTALLGASDLTNVSHKAKISCWVIIAAIIITALIVSIV